MTISRDLVDFLELDKELEKAGNLIDDEEEYDYDFYEEYLTQIKCPSCYRSHNIHHFECAEYTDVCTCPPGGKDSAYHCEACDVLWDADTNEVINLGKTYSYSNNNSLFDDDDYSISDYDSTYPKANGSIIGAIKKTPLGAGGLAATGYSFKSCSHKHVEVKLADETPIFCSAGRESAVDRRPDFGLYADSIWWSQVKWRNEFIAWPDYGIPSEEDVGLTQIYEAYWKATQGQMVEIGCIGGHGRTGTILAIMQVAAGQGNVGAKEAIDFVRDTYCSSAIESDIQEWYIEYAASAWYGHDLSDKPAVTTGGTAYNCNASDHFAMMLRGHTKCSKKGANCYFWKEDSKAFAKKPEDRSTADITSLEKAFGLLKDYDYVYGGLMRLDTDNETSPCTPFDHYAMITLGHEEACIRLKDCNWWDSDLLEWQQHGTINQVGDWTNDKSKNILKELYELYPAVEQYNADVIDVVGSEVEVEETDSNE